MGGGVVYLTLSMKLNRSLSRAVEGTGPVKPGNLRIAQGAKSCGLWPTDEVDARPDFCVGAFFDEKRRTFLWLDIFLHPNP